MFQQLQDQLKTFWDQQSFGQRLVIIVLVLAALILIPILFSWANSPSYSVAYSGISEADAGAIIEKLDTAGISYQLQGSGTISVPSDQVYETRMMMARDGLPKGDSAGFEVFNGNTLGMTTFSQEVNYQQALESELERTISNMSTIESVRVHIVTPEKSLLTSDQAPTTASVVVNPSGGQFLDSAQIQSITHLVSSAVEGLKPEHVAVADMNGNLLASGQGEQGLSSAGQVDSRRAAELAAAAAIKNNVQVILDSALGPNRAIVQAAVQMDWTEKEVKTQAYDPDTAAVRSSQSITESYASDDQLPEGVPGAESNLPDEVEPATAGEEGLAYQRQEEITNYELTQTETIEMYPAGEVKNISLSVLVDGDQDTAQLASIRTAVAAAAGIDEDRGDILAVENIAFDRSYFDAQAEDMQASEQLDLYMTIGKNAAVVLGLIFLFLYIQRMLKRVKVKSSEDWTLVMQPVSALTAGGGQQLPASAPQAQLQQGLPQIRPSSQPENKGQQTQTPDLITTAQAPPTAEPTPQAQEDQSQQIKQLTDHLSNEDPSEIAEVVRMWINEG